MSSALEKISGMGGFNVNNTTSARTLLEVESIVVMSDCVFTAFFIGGINVMATKNMAGITFPAGAYLPTDPNVKITAYTLASGSVIEYK